MSFTLLFFSHGAEMGFHISVATSINMHTFTYTRSRLCSSDGKANNTIMS